MRFSIASALIGSVISLMPLTLSAAPGGNEIHGGAGNSGASYSAVGGDKIVFVIRLNPQTGEWTGVELPDCRLVKRTPPGSEFTVTSLECHSPDPVQPETKKRPLKSHLPHLRAPQTHPEHLGNTPDERQSPSDRPWETDFWVQDWTESFPQVASSRIGESDFPDFR